MRSAIAIGMLAFSMLATAAPPGVGTIVLVPPPPSVGPVTGNANLPSAPSAAAMLGPFKVELGKTTLTEVSTAVGAGSFYHLGGAPDDRYWLCYLVRDAKQDARVWLLSFGGKVDDPHPVTEIHVQDLGPAGTYHSMRTCPLLPSNYNDVSFDHGIHLGSSATEVSKALGPQAAQRQDWTVYSYDAPVTSGGKPCKEDDVLGFKTEQGVVIELDVFKTTSC